MTSPLLWTSQGGFAPLQLGGLLTYAASFELDVAPLVAFAAGGFIYIAAADLISEVSRPHDARSALVNLLCVSLGATLLLALRTMFGPA